MGSELAKAARGDEYATLSSVLTGAFLQSVIYRHGGNRPFSLPSIRDHCIDDSAADKGTCAIVNQHDAGSVRECGKSCPNGITPMGPAGNEGSAGKRGKEARRRRGIGGAAEQ